MRNLTSIISGTITGRLFKKTTAAIVAIAMGATSLVAVAPANAHDPSLYRHYPGGHYHYLPRKRLRAIKRRQAIKRHRAIHRNAKRRANGGELLAAGIIGLALGAVIANNNAKQKKTIIVKRPKHTYRPIQHGSAVERRPLADIGRYDDLNDTDPKVIRFNENDLGNTYEPWTREWALWCDAKYRSFDIKTGTYRGYDGRDHFCIVK